MATFSLHQLSGAGRSSLIPPAPNAHDDDMMPGSAPNDSIYSSSARKIKPASSYDSRAGATRPSRPSDSRSQHTDFDTTMNPRIPTSNTLTQRPTSNHAKLRKRGGSNSTNPTAPPPFPGKHSLFTTPFATYEEPCLPEIIPTSSLSATPRIKPYLRKMSSAKDDQGKLDLSRSTAEFNPTAGLGIDEVGNKSASDVSFTHAGRRGTHTRDTSVGSQISTGSGSYRPTQPFVHPMRQTPRPYTPPLHSYASSLNDEEANESDDVVIDDDLRLATTTSYRPQRSMSISSFPQPTPLSQSHTAEDLAAVTRLTSASQTNVSFDSGRSIRSLKTKTSRLRGDTLLSTEIPNSPSSRTSFDKAVSFVSRRSDPDPQSRDDRIRAARRKFEAKEAEKDRKAHKRHESTDSKASKKPVSDFGGATQPSVRESSPRKKKGKKHGVKDAEKLHSTSYDETRPAHVGVLPHYGSDEKAPRVRERKGSITPQGNWIRFSAWFQTRLLECGGGRR